MTKPRLPAAAALLALSLAPLAAQTPPVPLGPLGGNLESIAIDPTDPNVVLVIDYGVGLLRSTDGGLSFSPFGSGASPNIEGLTPDPRDAATLLVRDDKRIYRSTDFGANWSVLGLTANQKLKALAAPSSGTGLLALDSFDVHHSNDNGATWSIVASTVPFAGQVFNDVAYAPSDSNVAYFGSTQTVFKSIDGGASFASTGFSVNSKAVTVAPGDANIVFTGTSSSIFRSTNGGASFVEAKNGLIPNITLFFAWEPSGNVLWHGGLTKMHSTSDLGNNWTNRDEGFREMPAFPGTWELIPLDMAFTSTGERYLAAQSNYINSTLGGGVYRRTTLTQPWDHLGLSGVQTFDVEIAGSGGTRVVGSGAGPLAGAPGQQLSPSIWASHVGTLEIDPTDPDRWVGGGVSAIVDNAQIVVLTNGGTAPQLVYNNFGAGIVQDIAFSPNDPNRVMAGIFPAGFGNEAIVVSSNGGGTWTEVPGTSGWATRAVAFNPHNPGNALQLSDNNSWAVSFNYGQTWSSLQPPWPGTARAVLLAYDPFTPGVLYRGDAGIGLWRSKNGGDTWQQLGVGLHDDSSIELHPEFPGLLFVSDNNGAVLMSGDGGNNFVQAFAVPGGSNASGLAVDTSDGTLLVGTTGASAWEIPAASPYVKIGDGTAGTNGTVPRHYHDGGLPQVGNPDWGVVVDQALGGASGFLLLSAKQVNIPIFGGKLFVGSPGVAVAVSMGGASGVGGSGSTVVPIPIPNEPLIAGASIVTQFLVLDSGAAHPNGAVWSDGMRTTLIP